MLEPFAASALRFALGRRLSILTFHDLESGAGPASPGASSVTEFEWLLRAFRDRLNFLPLGEAVKCLRAGTLPKGAACVTFDDGYESWLSLAAPILQRLGIPATFFVTTGQLEGETLWNVRLREVLSRAPAYPERLDLLADLNITEPPTDFHIESLVKQLAPGERNRVLSRLENQLRLIMRVGSTISNEDVRALHRLGFEIGAHTVNHPLLSRCSLEQSAQEIFDCKRALEQILGHTVAGFAYPNGRPGDDFDERHVRLVEQAGFRYAVTTAWGAASAETHPLMLPRFTPWGPGPWPSAFQLVRNSRIRSSDPPKAVFDEGRGKDDGPAELKKKALLVAFHFPPQAGSSGLLRTLNFSRHLLRWGWQADVLTSTAGAYEKTSLDLIATIPPSTKVIRASALDVARDLSWRGKYLDFLALPDRWGSWAVTSIFAGWRHIRRMKLASTPVRVVWSTYPLATAHLVGWVLSRLSGLPWVADFRDPMVSAGFPRPGLRRLVLERIEGAALRKAALVVFTTQHAAHAYASRYPGSEERLLVIENGYDEQVFQVSKPQRFGVHADRLLFLHSGAIYPGDRDPAAFFRAVASLVEKGVLLPEQVCLRFRATGHDHYVREVARVCGVESMLDLAGSVPYEDAIGEMMAADLLVLFQGSQFNAQIPAKVYEYLRAGRPILALLDEEGQTAKVLRDFATPFRISIDSDADIQAAITQWLEVRHQPSWLSKLEGDVLASKRFSREHGAQRLAQALQEIDSAAVGKGTGSAAPP